MLLKTRTCLLKTKPTCSRARANSSQVRRVRKALNQMAALSPSLTLLSHDDMVLQLDAPPDVSHDDKDQAVPDPAQALAAEDVPAASSSSEPAPAAATAMVLLRSHRVRLPRHRQQMHSLRHQSEQGESV